MTRGLKTDIDVGVGLRSVWVSGGTRYAMLLPTPGGAFTTVSLFG